MSILDDGLKRASALREEWRNVRELLEQARVYREANMPLVKIAKTMVGNHMDDMADARPRAARKRMMALRAYIVGPRPAYKVLTADEWKRQVDIASLIRASTNAGECLDLCDQALQLSMELLDAHDTEDVLADVEPLMMIAYDAQEQAHAWYEEANLRITWGEYLHRKQAGLPDVAVEFIRQHGVDNPASIGSAGTLAAPSAETVAAHEADRAASSPAAAAETAAAVASVVLPSAGGES